MKASVLIAWSRIPDVVRIRLENIGWLLLTLVVGPFALLIVAPVEFLYEFGREAKNSFWRVYNRMFGNYWVHWKNVLKNVKDLLKSIWTGNKWTP